MQPALDNEISQRQTNEGKINSKLEKTTTKLAEELDAVTKKAFLAIDESRGKVADLEQW
jgi:hypothetical protein